MAGPSPTPELSTVLEITRALGSELGRAPLVRELLRIALAETGAARAALFAPAEGGWTLEAHAPPGGPAPASPDGAGRTVRLTRGKEAPALLWLDAPTSDAGVATLELVAPHAANALANSRLYADLGMGQRAATVLDAIPQLIWLATPAGHVERQNERWYEYTGASVAQAKASGWADFIHADDRERVTALWEKALADGRPFEYEARLRRADGEYRWFHCRSQPSRDAGGAVDYWCGTATDVHERRRAIHLAEGEKRMLELIASGAELRDVLTAACAMSEAERPGTMTSILLLDDDGVHVRHGAAPSLPDGYNRAIDGAAIGPNAGSCGTAAYRRELVIVEDIATSPLWSDYRALALPYGLRACWSWPVLGRQGVVLGTFAVYRKEPARPTEDDLHLSGLFTNLVSIAIERWRAEQSVRAGERRYALTLASIGDAVIATDATGRITFVNAMAEAWGGVAAGAALGRPFAQVFRIVAGAGDDRPADPVSRVIAERTRLGTPDRAMLAGRPVDATSAPIFDDEGVLAGVVVVLRDVSQRLASERTAGLEEANASLELALRGSQTAIFDVELAEGVAAEHMRLRATTTHLMAGAIPTRLQTVGDLLARIHPDDREATRAAFQATVSRGVPFMCEWRLLRADGQYTWRMGRGEVVREPGRPPRLLGCTTDVDERRRHQEALREAKEQAEAANRAKDDFLANVSHEIRTPMNAILGMTEMVLDSPLGDGQRQSLKTVHSASTSLLGMINDLLDFSKIEAGKLELDARPFRLRAEVGDALGALAVRAHHKGLELACDVDPRVPDALVGDAGRLRQVLMNVIGNAIKFTERGEVVVAVGLDPASDAGRALLRVDVRDTGIGVPREKQDAIFRAFEQVDAGTTRRFGGTGLGLTIAARLVALLGGGIGVRSEPGAGSTFSFTAAFAVDPSAPSAPADAPARSPAALRGLRVLVVDDNASARRILEGWLRRWELEPIAVDGAAAALDALRQAAAAGRPFQLVLLDARMPNADGIALAAQIRESRDLAATRIILLTSGDRPGDAQRTAAVKLDAYLMKPATQDEVLSAILRVISRNDPSSARGAPSPAAPAARPLSILVAEDNELNSVLIQKLLTSRGHHVDLVGDGQAALDRLESSAFDLVLLDLHMPTLDGFGVIAALRARERGTGTRLPVVALTARSRKEDRDRCLAAGMDEFVTKPIAATELWAVLDRVLAER